MKKILCNECNKLLFETTLESDGEIGFETQRKGFIFKMAGLYSDKYNCLYFCNKKCAKLFYGKNIPKNPEVTQSLNDLKKKIPEYSKEIASKMNRLVKLLNTYKMATKNE